MANKQNANTFYIDTQYSSGSDDLVIKDVKVLYVVVNATAANAVLVLADAQSGSPKKLEFRVATSGDSRAFRLDDCPVRFPNGIRALTLTNATASVVYQDTRS